MFRLLLLQSNTLERRLFYIPSFKIYGSVAGFYDYGPPGCAIKQNVTQVTPAGRSAAALHSFPRYNCEASPVIYSHVAMLLFCMADAELQACCWFADQGPWLPAFSCTACAGLL
jgi:hypothetical protein